MATSIEILCTACGADTLLRREPRFEGFKKVGEHLFCSACGHEFDREESVPFKASAGSAKIFTDEDRSARIEVFCEDEKGRVCRYCEHYTVNPFTQRCGFHNRIIEATDTCGHFVKSEEGGEGEAAQTCETVG